MRVIINYYNPRTLTMWIDFECLMKIIQESFPDCAEITFTEMSPSEKREAEGEMDTEVGITDIVSPFWINTVDIEGNLKKRPDLTDRTHKKCQEPLIDLSLALTGISRGCSLSLQAQTASKLWAKRSDTVAPLSFLKFGPR